MIQIPDKTNKPVGLIITQEMKAMLDLLTQCRGVVGIDPDNTFLFPRTTGGEHIKGHQCLRQLADSARLEFPKRVCATTLRKYTATVIQVNLLSFDNLRDVMYHSFANTAKCQENRVFFMFSYLYVFAFLCFLPIHATVYYFYCTQYSKYH